MKIEGKGLGATPAERLKAIQGREGAPDQRKTPVEGATRTDRVEISAAAKARAQGVDSGSATQPVPADATDRIDQVRDRVQSGFYASDEVQAAVARQIVARGDHLS